MKLIRILWIYPCNVFVIKDTTEFKLVEPAIKCRFIPISSNNCHRVTDFREEGRVSEYRSKLVRNEIGYFAEHEGEMIGSVWATINKTQTPRIVQTFKKVMHNEGLVHDIVTSEKCRGTGIGPFMVSRIVPLLLNEHGLSRIIIDVNIRNRASLRMMEKLDLSIDHRMLYVAVFGGPVLKLILRKYA